MTNERWKLLMDSDRVRLTPEEVKEGWHFCPDWDDLLIGPSMQEAESCYCPILDMG